MKRKLWSAVFCAVVVGSLFAVEIREQKVGGETSRWFEEMVPQADGVRIYTYGSVPAPGVKCPFHQRASPCQRYSRSLRKSRRLWSSAPAWLTRIESSWLERVNIEVLFRGQSGRVVRARSVAKQR